MNGAENGWLTRQTAASAYTRQHQQLINDRLTFICNKKENSFAFRKQSIHRSNYTHFLSFHFFF
jgi:uncharacterized protein (DUF1684 family)